MPTNTLIRRPWHYAMLALAFVAALSLVVVACGDDDDDDNGNEPTTAPTEESTPTTESTPPGEESPSPGASPTDEAPAQLPNNAQEYALDTMAAWANGDMEMLAQLATGEVVAVLEGIEPGDPSNWGMTGCDGATGQVSCSFESTDGTAITLLIDNAAAAASEPGAVVEARVP